MNTKTTFIAALAVSVFGMLLLNFSTTHASGGLLITEIMYDVPGTNTGRQWVEVKNTSADPIDLGAKDIRLMDTSGSHLIKAYQSGSTILNAGEVAVIAENPDEFMVDWPAYSGVLLKSAFTLPANNSGIVEITQAGVALTKAAYSPALGAHNDGNSLQRKGDKFVPGAPTPGIYPLIPPGAIAPTPKLSASAKSSTKQAGHKSHAVKNTSKSKKSKASAKPKASYDKGTLAPATSADADVAGAFPLSLSFVIDPLIAFITLYKPVLYTEWFIWFLALLAFSGFSLIVLDIHGRTRTTA
jgi:hypothetical protein